jgi:hypothetical protein
MSKSFLDAVLGLALIGGGVAVAQKPVEDVSGERHPNLAAAERLSQQAYEKVTAAQQAHEWDMEGHAAKVEDLLCALVGLEF